MVGWWESGRAQPAIRNHRKVNDNIWERARLAIESARVEAELSTRLFKESAGLLQFIYRGIIELNEMRHVQEALLMESLLVFDPQVGPEEPLRLSA
jgi:hypothetical protein